MFHDEAHRFRDEWLTRVASKLPGVTADVVRNIRLEKKSYLSHALLRARIVDLPTLTSAIKSAYRIDYVEPTSASIDRVTLGLVPEKICRRHLMLPLRCHDETIEMAMSSPIDVNALADVESVTARRPMAFYCLPERIESLLEEFYKPDGVVYDLLSRIEETQQVEILEGGQEEYEGEGLPQAPVIKLINSLIARAVRMRASDIHVEHEEDATLVRFRVDGLLRNVMTIPCHLGRGAVVSRVKIISNLDIAEHRRPQDGRAKLKVGGAEIGLRVSILPTSFGEKVVMRILDKRTAQVPFEKLGFRSNISQRIDSLLQNSQGIFLVTGPTGAGKTTTLYSIINRIKSEQTNIVTIEDPIEYKIEGINQVPVNEKKGLTFPIVLRSVLRQDPDIILVGEIRDGDTASIAFQAAQTGHLVLTTVHTNDTVSSIMRLVDIGVEPFKVAAGLLGITAQRLVRKLCPSCQREVETSSIPAELVEDMRREGVPVRLFKAVGCNACDFGGYRGQFSLIELLEITSRMKDLISMGESHALLREAALAEGSLQTLRNDAMWHLSQGDTTLDEIRPHVPVRTTSSVSPSTSEQTVSRRKVMIVDDDAATRLLLTSTLRNRGYETIEAEDGQQALERISGTNPNLVLLDLTMPRMDGYEVVRRIRKDLGMLDLPIIVLTASSGDDSQIQSLSIGADDYIIKPIKPPVLSARIDALFRRLKS